MSYQVNITLSDFVRLKEEFPDKSESLESVVTYRGSKATILLADLTPEVRRDFGEDLSNRLFRLAVPLSEARALSYHLQTREVLALPRSKSTDILEVGPGRGEFGALVRNYGYNLITIDADPNTGTDILADMREIPVLSKVFDVVCAFEVLQHLPHEFFQSVLAEFTRCARNYVYLSLPSQGSSIYLQVKGRFTGRLRPLSFDIGVSKLLPSRVGDVNDSQLMNREDYRNPHYWEVNRRSFPEKRVLGEIEECGLKVLKAFHNPRFTYHYFILCEVA